MVVFTLPGVQGVDRCLDSLGWADAVDVCTLDGDPSRGTPRQRGATDWVLYLWGHERVDAELAESVRDILNSPGASTATEYCVRVRSRLLDVWLEASCWGPSPSPRLLRNGFEDVPWGWNSGGFDFSRTPVVPGWVYDHSFEEITNGVGQLNGVSSILARTVTAVPDGPLELIRLPVRVLCRLFFRQNLWRRGLPGLALSLIAAYGCTATLMKAWEARLGRGRPERDAYGPCHPEPPLPRDAQHVER